MSIRDRRQLEVTREKLHLLETRLRQLEVEPVVNQITRQWTRRSLKKLINQMKEEIVVFTSRQASPTK